MAWTQAEIDILKASIASGERRVKYQDKEVEYRSLAEMKEILRGMEAEVSPSSVTCSTRRTGYYSKGV